MTEWPYLRDDTRLGPLYKLCTVTLAAAITICHSKHFNGNLGDVFGGWRGSDDANGLGGIRESREEDNALIQLDGVAACVCVHERVGICDERGRVH